MTQGIMPGESILTKPNGNVILTMRNGETHEFTPEEWQEHNSEYMGDLSLTDRIDLMLDSIKHKNIVQASEMIDGLLDLRQKAVSTEEAARRAVSMMIDTYKRYNPSNDESELSDEQEAL